MRALNFGLVTSVFAVFVACSSFGTDPEDNPSPTTDGGSTSSSSGGGGDDAAQSADASSDDPSVPPTACSTGEFLTQELVPWAAGHASMRLGIAGAYSSYKEGVGDFNLDCWLVDEAAAGAAHQYTTIGGLNDTKSQANPAPFDGDLSLAYEQNQSASAEEIFIARRLTTMAPFAAPPESLAFDFQGAPNPRFDHPYVIGDHLYYRYGDTSFAARKIRMATIDADRAKALNSIDAIGDKLGLPQAFPVVTTNELTLFFGSPAPPGSASLNRIWVAHRTSTGAPFTNSTLLTGLVNNAGDETWPTWISDDGCTLYYVRLTGSTFSLWRAHRTN